MKSSAYIGQGIRESTRVMKVGKSNDVKRRQRELPITIERIAVCVSEAAAYQFENDLRRFIIQQGGIRYQKTLDWFEFDERIYKLLSQFFEPTASEEIHELTENEEIQLFREKYRDLLQQTLDAAEDEIGYLRKRLDEVREEEQTKSRDREEKLRDEIIELNRQMARLELRIEMMQEKDEDEDD